MDISTVLHIEKRIFQLLHNLSKSPWEFQKETERNWFMHMLSISSCIVLEKVWKLWSVWAKYRVILIYHRLLTTGD